MRIFLCRTFILTLSIFFIPSFSMAAMSPDSIEWEMVDAPYGDPQKSTSGDLGQGPSGSNASEKETRLRKIKLEIIMEAHYKIFDSYKNAKLKIIKIPDYDPLAYIELEALERKEADIRRTLYASPIKIKEWQIFQQAANITIEKINKGSKSSQQYIWNLEALHKMMLRDRDNALSERKFFLEDSLKIATDLNLWITFYKMHKSLIDSEYPTVSQKLNKILIDTTVIHQCEHLYQSQDSIQNSLALDMQECKDLLRDITTALRPFHEKKEDSIAIWSFYTVNFLEKIQEEFSNSNKIQASFNLDDGNIVLEILKDVIKFYSIQLDKEVDQLFTKVSQKKLPTLANIVAGRFFEEAAAIPELKQVAKMAETYLLKVAEVKNIEAAISPPIPLAATIITGGPETPASRLKAQFMQKRSKNQEAKPQEIPLSRQKAEEAALRLNATLAKLTEEAKIIEENVESLSAEIEKKKSSAQTPEEKAAVEAETTPIIANARKAAAEANRKRTSAITLECAAQTALETAKNFKEEAENRAATPEEEKQKILDLLISELWVLAVTATNAAAIENNTTIYPEIKTETIKQEAIEIKIAEKKAKNLIAKKGEEAATIGRKAETLLEQCTALNAVKKRIEARARGARKEEIRLLETEEIAKIKTKEREEKKVEIKKKQTIISYLFNPNKLDLEKAIKKVKIVEGFATSDQIIAIQKTIKLEQDAKEARKNALETERETIKTFTILIAELEKLEKEIEIQQKIELYEKCFTLKKLFFLHGLLLPEPKNIWNCQSLQNDFNTLTQSSMALLSNQYAAAEALLLQKKPLHPWLKLDLRMKALQHLSTTGPEHYRSHLQEAIAFLSEEIEEYKKDYAPTFKTQLKLMLHHAFMKKLIQNTYLPDTKSDGGWTDYVKPGIINQETIEAALEDSCMGWENKLLRPLSDIERDKLLSDAWNDIKSPEPEKACIDIGSTSNDGFHSEHPPTDPGHCSQEEYNAYSHHENRSPQELTPQPLMANQNDVKSPEPEKACIGIGSTSNDGLHLEYQPTDSAHCLQKEHNAHSHHENRSPQELTPQPLIAKSNDIKSPEPEEQVFIYIDRPHHDGLHSEHQPNACSHHKNSSCQESTLQPLMADQNELGLEQDILSQKIPTQHTIPIKHRSFSPSAVVGLGLVVAGGALAVKLLTKFKKELPSKEVIAQEISNQEEIVDDKEKISPESLQPKVTSKEPDDLEIAKHSTP